MVLAQVLAAQPCVDPPVGLVSWWPGDGTAQDIRSSNHGAFVNGAMCANGKVGQGFLFDGIDDYVQVSSVAGLALPSVTVEAWVQPAVTDRFQRILHNSAAYDLFIDDAAYLRFIISPESMGGGTSVDVGWAGPVTAGVWIHVAGTYDEATGVGRIYLNGVLRAFLDLQDANPLVGHGSTVTVGAYGGFLSYFQGAVDEASVYDRALTGAEIQGIVNADTAGKCKSAVHAGSCQTERSWSLNQNFPNPFNPVTTFQFTIVDRQLTIVNVIDVLGREVATLVNEVKEPGTYAVRWDAVGMSSGVYFYRLQARPLSGGQAGTFVATRKTMLLR
jgi:hypothetical protein